jgi:hypothetical protein
MVESDRRESTLLVPGSLCLGSHPNSKQVCGSQKMAVAGRLAIHLRLELARRNEPIPRSIETFSHVYLSLLGYLHSYCERQNVSFVRLRI